MKVLFAYNGRVEVDELGRYYGNELNDRLVERYRFFGEQVSFIVRARRINNKNAHELQSFDSDVHILTVPEMNTPSLFLQNRKKIQKRVLEAVQTHDIIIARQPGYVGRMATRYARALKKPCLVEVVGDPYDALSNHSLLGKMYAPFARISMRKSISSASPVLYVTSQYLQKLYPSYGLQIGLSDVVLQSLESSVLSKRLSKIQTGDWKKDLIVGTAAALDVRYKGQRYVIDAMAKAKSAGVRITYRLIGKGNGHTLKAHADALGVGDQLQVVGQVPHEKVFEFFDDIDVYIQPSVTEGLPRALVEAMSRACPSFGTNVGGIPELLPEEDLFEKRNVQEIAHLLTNLTPEKMEAMAKRNFAQAENFDTTLSGTRRKEFYTECMSAFNKL